MTPRTQGRGPLALAVAAALALAGCSFVMMKGPPSPLSPGAPPACTSTRSPAVADFAAFLAGGTIMVAFFIAAAAAELDGDGDSQAMMGTIVGLGSIPFALSGGYGMYQSGRCREANKTWRVMHGAGPAASPAEASAPGAEGGACRATEPACEPGLTCASRHCVRLP